ncbi:MAG TPA: hypothetical protein VFU47_07330, partial [Armatimonadota bacterium]|nr:hypothetical protein [Armatimonadota bacterium]
DRLPGIDPKQPVTVDINFLTSGNYLLVVGSTQWVDSNIETVRLMGYLFERPRAHLQLNLRVVQLTGPANAEVIQMAETVRALVDAQREEVVRTFGDLNDYLLERLKQQQLKDRQVYDAARQLFPTLGNGSRPLSVPEIVLLLMLDRSAPVPGLGATLDANQGVEAAFLALPRSLGDGFRDTQRADDAMAKDIQDELAAWKKAVTGARDWCGQYAEEIKKAKDNSGLGAFRASLDQPNLAIPSWLARRLKRSLELTERLYPGLARKHTEDSLRELQRRFTTVLEREAAIEQALAKGEEPPKDKAMPADGSRVRRSLVALKSLSEELVPSPLALFENVAVAADNAAPTPDQLIDMFRQYAAERRKLENRLATDDPGTAGEVNYARLQSLEASLNLWLRRTSEAMARSLENQFYRRYVDELRVMANKDLGKGSSRDLLSDSNINEVPDVARDLLLSDNGVNIFVSNSISLQFSQEVTNSVSANVQASLPSKLSILERVQQASQAASAMNALTQQYGINGESIVKALLAGGQAVPVQSGINLSAQPSIGFDASTITLTLTANQTLQPNTDKVADRVTNHTINNATVTALSYEPMVLSTLASNVSYFENTGGIPVLRKTPIIKNLLKDIPIAPFKEGKRQKGVYQSSVIILEPVVIPTIEDLVRFHSGWTEPAAGPGVTVQGDVNSLFGPADGTEAPTAAPMMPMPAASPAPAGTAPAAPAPAAAPAAKAPAGTAPATPPASPPPAAPGKSG